MSRGNLISPWVCLFVFNIHNFTQTFIYVVKNKFSNNLWPEFEFKGFFFREMYLSLLRWSSLAQIICGIISINNYCFPTYWRCEMKWLQNFSIFIYSTQRIPSEVISTLITQRACYGTKEERTVEKLKFGFIHKQ